MEKGHNFLTGGQVLIDSLVINDANMAFCVPGESYLSALNALYNVPSIQLITCRHEGGAAMMAEAFGKLTGKPGLCFVTRGPGATNASSGVHVAFQDSTPFILFVGQVSRTMRDREAFQEIDYRHMFGSMAKWVAEIDYAERIPEYINRAYHTAMAGRPGPVVLSIPEDMLDDQAPVPALSPAHRIQPAPHTHEIEELRSRFLKAKSPMILLGGNFWSQTAVDNVQVFAEVNHLPVACAFRCQHLFNNEHPNYAGDVGIGINPKLAERISKTDLLVAIGTRLGEITTSGYSLLRAPIPEQDLVHIYPGAEELGRVYRPVLAINSGMTTFAQNLREMGSIKPSWAESAQQAHADYRMWSEPTKVPGGVNLGIIVHMLREAMEDDAVVTNGAGNFASFLHRFYRYRNFNTQLAPTSGSMGYGVPAGIVAKSIYPNRCVVTLAGDGDFLMTGQELATAIHHGINVIILIVNNGMYGTIRMHQEKSFPGRTIGTTLSNPNFQLLASAYGAHGELVTLTEDFPAAFQRAKNCGKPALIELRVDPEAITPSTSLSEFRASE
ncbi:MAG: thiamine pyrophosphate-binding protein [Rhodospirillaceae bacterium TMED8]|nr:thiamine pyrophosphate-binding protein [Magnetovibrio sp.]OUT48913.1 MAG: thiamine pyrophosphate-binding protein [Rhodospirillaceae bacterium TMED8]